MITTRTSLAATMLRLWSGKVLNALGVPGIVRPGTYEAGIQPASVRIIVGSLFTVVTVNGIDVYLHRFTGAIDGVGFSMPTPSPEPIGSERRNGWSREAAPTPSAR